MFKIVTSSELVELLQRGHYAGSVDDCRDGFIHLCALAQIESTVAAHFAGHRDLFLLGFESDQLAPELKWESSRSGALFPHLYRPLRISEIKVFFPILHVK